MGLRILTNLLDKVFGCAEKLLRASHDGKVSYLIRGRTPADLTSQGFCQNRDNYINIDAARRRQ